MKLTDLELSERHAAGLVRLLEKMGVSAAASRDSGDICRRTYGVEVRAGSVDKATRSVDVTASTAAIDSYDEIVKQDWMLERYRSNPVVLYAHNAVGLCGPAEDTLPIGHASDVGVRNGRLEARLHFVDEKANPLAEKVWQGFVQGSLRAVSVGFRPRKVTDEINDEGQEITVLSENELFEISACPIPANPEAVARSIERNREQARRLAARDNPAPATKPTKELNTMELEQLKAQLAARENELAQERAKSAALETQNAALVKERDDAAAREKAALERATGSESKLVEAEVEKLIGVKIDPAEREPMIELAKSNRALFDKLVAQRAPKRLGEKIVGEDPAPPVSAEVAPDQGGDDLEDSVQKQLAG